MTTSYMFFDLPQPIADCYSSLIGKIRGSNTWLIEPGGSHGIKVSMKDTNGVSATVHLVLLKLEDNITRIKVTARYDGDDATFLNKGLDDLIAPFQERAATHLHARRQRELELMALQERFKEEVAQTEAMQRKETERAEAKHRKVERLRTLLESNQGNPDLNFELGFELVALVIPSIKMEGTNYWEEIHVWQPFSEPLREAKEKLNLALAIGLKQPLDSAKARFLTVELSLSEMRASPSKAALDKHPHLEAMVLDIVTETQKYLRHDPHNLEALMLQRAAYKLVGNRNGLGKAELALSQARALLQAGLNNSHRKPRRGTSKIQRSGGLDLEQSVQRLLERMGLRATTTKTTGDGGIDIVAFSDRSIFSGKYIVQCKDWTNPVGEPVVRDLFGLVIAEGANKGILITTSRFTKAAERFADGKPIELIDGDTLRRLLSEKGLRKGR